MIAVPVLRMPSLSVCGSSSPPTEWTRRRPRSWLPSGASRANAVLGDTAVLRLADRVHDQLVGAGPLAPLLADPAVTDVLVNGVQVWVDRGAGLQRAPVEIGEPDDVRRLAQRLAAACGRRLDDGQPYADARLPDGTRLHAVLPPVATTGPYLSLRTFRQRPFSLDDLVEHGTVAADVAPLLAAVVAARLAYLVTGGTGSGKTTLLGTLLGMVPPTERIVLVEDAAELRPVHPHVVALQARTANVEGAGAVGLTDLVRQALRMRPDRLVVGECRGAEIADLLGALNTGHDGGAGTLHANAPLTCRPGWRRSACWAGCRAPRCTLRCWRRCRWCCRCGDPTVDGCWSRSGCCCLPGMSGWRPSCRPGSAGGGWDRRGRRSGD